MSRLMRWEPFVGPLSLRGAMERLLEDSFVRPSPFRPVGMDLALDMYETDDDIVVKVAVPGIKPEDIEITLTGDTLTIKGEAKREENIEEWNYIRQERSYGRFSRSITLPGKLVADNTKAEFEHGVLTLTVPKIAEVKPRSIKVKVK